MAFTHGPPTEADCSHWKVIPVLFVGLAPVKVNAARVEPVQAVIAVWLIEPATGFPEHGEFKVVNVPATHGPKSVVLQKERTQKK